MRTVTESAYILAGGRSRRMGRDKLFLECQGQSLLSRALATCGELFRTVKVVAKDRGKFKSLGCDVILDWPHAEGPLAGVIAALQDCSSDCCFVTAADLYDLDDSTILRLMDAYDGEQYVGIQEGDRVQPLCGIYHRSVLTHLVSQAAQGEYRMRTVLMDLHYRFLPVCGKRWRNINCERDLMGIIDNHG